MTIYQLHECGGVWDGSYNDIVASYLHKDKAEEGKRICETVELDKRVRHRKCNRCPFINKLWFNKDRLLEEYSDYCDKADLKESLYGIDCQNFFAKYDDSEFYIQEVHVIE